MFSKINCCRTSKLILPRLQYLLLSKHFGAGRADAKLAAQELRKMGPETILLSLGSAGSVYCSSESLIHIRPAELAVQSTVGAGDAVKALATVLLGHFLAGPTRG
ncbi:MAG: hypothetical protein EBX94_07930, partial [Burkholderiaceae bacterium]|nr:hypothetical protein [Burkholderiaceae bacterium]